MRTKQCKINENLYILDNGQVAIITKEDDYDLTEYGYQDVSSYSARCLVTNQPLELDKDDIQNIKESWVPVNY